MSTMEAKKALVEFAAKSIDLTKAEMKWSLTIDRLQEDIVALYQGGDYAEYKRDWNAVVIAHFQEKGIDLTMKIARKPNWELISTIIINRLGRYVYPNFATIDGESTASSSARKSSVSVVSSDPMDSVEDAPTKIPKLSAVDKENVKLLYDRLERNKMWKLSSGTFVEEKMREVAIAMDHEHPTHSLIFDVTDQCWDDVFSENEKAEIRTFRATDMPLMSVEVDMYLAQLKNLSATELYEKVDSGKFLVESDNGWMQKSYRDAFRLVRSSFFPVQAQTEGSVVKRIWSAVDTCFDFSTVKSVCGEKCSKASADAANVNRCLSSFGRQSSGRKMDYMFTAKGTAIELGCGECGLVSGIKTTKELLDAGFKMPKVLKDMANSIMYDRSDLAHDLCMVGFYIGGDTMKLFTLDFPSGYVARLDGYGPVRFPNVENQICSQLPRVLRLILQGRWLMEACKTKIEEYNLEELVYRLGEIPRHIIRTFVPSASCKKQKKRKVGDDL